VSKGRQVSEIPRLTRPACLSTHGDQDTALLKVVHATNPAQSARLCNFISARFPILTHSSHLVADQAMPRK
jgi:hypothetical protein